MDLDYDGTGLLACGTCRDEAYYCGVKGLLAHYRTAHGRMSKYFCGQNDCGKYFDHLTSMIRHLKGSHAQLFKHCAAAAAGPGPSAGPSRCNVADGADEVMFDESADIHSNDDRDDEDDAENDTITACSNDGEDSAFQTELGPSLQDDLNKTAMRVLIGLRSTASLTGKAIQRFQAGSNLMVKQLLTSMKARVSAELLKKGLSDQDIADVFAGITVKDPFSNLKSIDDQLKTFSKEFGLVQPVPKLLGTRLDKRLDPSTNCRVQTQVKETFQYVPIIESLTSALRNKKMRDYILQSKPSSDGVLRSYLDGSHFREHSFLQRHEGVVLILLFFDELEIANSLGSKTIIHKLAAFFFQILNFPPEVSSELASIFLLALAYADDLKKEGAMEKVLTPLVQDLKKLSSDEGVLVDVDGEPVVLRAVLAGLSADTLAAHDLLGLLGVGAKYFCRRCLVSRDEVRRDANCVGQLRSEEQHKIHLEEVTRRPKFSSECGVKRKCPLDDAPYFHCTSSSIFDAFHDILEGVVPLTIKLTLRHFIFVKTFFNVTNLNLRIASFSYGVPDAKNRPSPNFTAEMLTTSKGKIKQYGSQMWCLMRALPFLIGEWVPEGDPYMSHIFLLQDIMKIIFSFEVTLEDVDNLDAMITAHHDSFMELFIQSQNEEYLVCEEVEEEGEVEIAAEEEREEEMAAAEGGGEVTAATDSNKKKTMGKVYVTNKLHHMKHYPELFLKYGPVIRLWCAKFEGRLKIFRQHASICCNFRNPPMTMAKMFQLSSMDILLNESSDEIVFQKGLERPVNRSAHPELFAAVGLSETCEVTYTNSASVHGEEYRPGLFVCLPGTADPLFALIKHVVVATPKVFLIVKPWMNNGLQPKYHAHSVSPVPGAEEVIIPTNSLRHFRCIAPWTTDESTEIFLSMRTILT